MCDEAAIRFLSTGDPADLDQATADIGKKNTAYVPAERRKLTGREKVSRIGLVLLIAAGVTVVGFNLAEGDSAPKECTDITVEQGDTVWKIVQSEVNDRDIRPIVDGIVADQLDGNDAIQPGQVISVCG